MPANYLVIKDEAIQLKSNDFEARKVSLEFDFYFVANGLAILNFNVSASGITDGSAGGATETPVPLIVNTAVKINGVEIQRYALSEQITHSIHEVFSVDILKNGKNTIEYEIVDTPLSLAGLIKISDAVIWCSDTS